MLGQVVAVEEDAGIVGEPLGGDTAPMGVDAEHAPAAAVATWSIRSPRRCCISGSTLRAASLWRLKMMSPARTC